MDVVLASRNTGKLAELSDLLGSVGWRLLPAAGFGGDAPGEPAPTFVENALIKARHASRLSKLPAIADDSGIEIDFLGGAPGVGSARYAGDKASDADNNARLLDDLRQVPEAQRTARYACVLVFLRSVDDPAPVIAEGYWRGRILEAPRGTGGFGYDPLFWIEAHGCTSAELPAALKNRLSHRARAASALLAKLRG